jgi:hypothetical protein
VETVAGNIPVIGIRPAAATSELLSAAAAKAFSVDGHCGPAKVQVTRHIDGEDTSG